MALCTIAIAAGVVGVIAAAKRLVFRRRFGVLGCGAGGHGGFSGHGRFGRGPGQSFWLRALFGRLDTTPGQEREIRAALEELRDRARDAKSGMIESRDGLGRAVAGDSFDDGAFESVSARFDATGEKMKDAVRGALRRIHAVLDPKQRERLAELVTKGAFRRWGGGGGGGGGGWGGYGGGPYRGGVGI